MWWIVPVTTYSAASATPLAGHTEARAGSGSVMAGASLARDEPVGPLSGDICDQLEVLVVRAA
jgi:hypothetical protein